MKIVLIGAGNVGSQLGIHLHSLGMDIQQVFSRKRTKARKLARSLHCEWTNDLSEIVADAQLYILAVKDDAIADVAMQISPTLKASNPLVVHTSGATPGKQLAPFFKRYGVLYPLQTFTRDRAADFANIPICYHANRKTDRNKLEKLARLIGPLSYQIDDRQRAVLHVAAVFVNNFTNHLYHIGQQIAIKEDLAFDLLKPLILETAKKIQQNDPPAMQTGPAIRGDQQTIQRHLDYLQKYPAYQEIYRIFTDQISNQ